MGLEFRSHINQVKSILPLMIDEFHPTRLQSQPSTHFNRQHYLSAGKAHDTHIIVINILFCQKLLFEIDNLYKI